MDLSLNKAREVVERGGGGLKPVPLDWYIKNLDLSLNLSARPGKLGRDVCGEGRGGLKTCDPWCASVICITGVGGSKLVAPELAV